ncbi:acyl-CoA dehydrogenase family protein [Nocardia sp. NPDC059246]|uniref:acyl-CoA dehydrogenase family protein n=1 Tax=unclassified Nocardia TaxID=2637762 RepID=UPI0036BBAD54
MSRHTSAPFGLPPVTVTSRRLKCSDRSSTPSTTTSAMSYAHSSPRKCVEIAEMATECAVTRSFLDRCIVDHANGELDAVHASMATWWATELAKRVADRCLQLHGGYGYMSEYPIARAFLDGRVQTIYGGATEIMKEIIGRTLLAQ